MKKVSVRTFLRRTGCEADERTEVLFVSVKRMVKVSASSKERISFGTGRYSIAELARVDWSAGPEVLIGPEALKDPSLHAEELTRLYDELAEKYQRMLEMHE